MDQAAYAAYYEHSLKDITVHAELFEIADSLSHSDIPVEAKNAKALIVLRKAAELPWKKVDGHGDPQHPSHWLLPVIVSKISEANFEKNSELKHTLDFPRETLMKKMPASLRNGVPIVDIWVCGENTVSLTEASKMFPVLTLNSI